MESSTTAGPRRPASIAGDHVQLPPRASAAQQGPSLPAGPADRGGDHRGDARRRRRSRRPAAARRDRRCSGAPACGSAKRSRSTRPTSTQTAAPCSSATARATSVARSGWTAGHGRTSTRGSNSAQHCRPARCSASCAVRHADGRARPPGSAPAPSRRPSGRCPAPVRAAPAPARARGRDVPRGDLADRDPATARARRPRDHLQIPARDRQHRDHPRRPPTARTDDPRRPADRHTPLRHTTRADTRGRASARPHSCCDRPRAHEYAGTTKVGQVAEAMVRLSPPSARKRSSGSGTEPLCSWFLRDPVASAPELAVAEFVPDAGLRSPACPSAKSLDCSQNGFSR